MAENLSKMPGDWKRWQAIHTYQLGDGDPGSSGKGDPQDGGVEVCILVLIPLHRGTIPYRFLEALR